MRSLTLPGRIGLRTSRSYRPKLVTETMFDSSPVRSAITATAELLVSFVDTRHQRLTARHSCAKKAFFIQNFVLHCHLLSCVEESSQLFCEFFSADVNRFLFENQMNMLPCARLNWQFSVSFQVHVKSSPSYRNIIQATVTSI